MSNVGLSNLSTLKSWLLPAGLVAGTDYDAQITAIGQGVFAGLQKHCNRLLARSVNDTFEISANRDYVVLPRYPIEAVPSIEQRDSLATGYLAQVFNDLVLDYQLSAGLIRFSGRPGGEGSRLKFTYTGGYFFETLEPTDGGYPTAAPAGSAAVPADLQLAWRLQCEFVWTQRDKLGLQVGEKPDNVSLGALTRLKLLDGVVELLAPHRRFTLT